MSRLHVSLLPLSVSCNQYMPQLVATISFTLGNPFAKTHRTREKITLIEIWCHLEYEAARLGQSQLSRVVHHHCRKWLTCLSGPICKDHLIPDFLDGVPPSVHLAHRPKHSSETALVSIGRQANRNPKVRRSSPHSLFRKFCFIDLLESSWK